MGIKLDIGVEIPLSDDDRDTLDGVSVMVVAIANRQNLTDQDLPHRPCGQQHSDRDLYCIRAIEHEGSTSTTICRGRGGGTAEQHRGGWTTWTPARQSVRPLTV